MFKIFFHFLNYIAIFYSFSKGRIIDFNRILIPVEDRK